MESMGEFRKVLDATYTKLAELKQQRDVALKNFMETSTQVHSTPDHGSFMDFGNAVLAYREAAEPFKTHRKRLDEVNKTYDEMLDTADATLDEIEEIQSTSGWKESDVKDLFTRHDEEMQAADDYFAQNAPN